MQQLRSFTAGVTSGVIAGRSALLSLADSFAVCAQLCCLRLAYHAANCKLTHSAFPDSVLCQGWMKLVCCILNCVAQ